jgi:hypothetical protein
MGQQALMLLLLLLVPELYPAAMHQHSSQNPGNKGLGRLLNPKCLQTTKALVLVLLVLRLLVVMLHASE